MTGMYDDAQALHLVDKSRLTAAIDEELKCNEFKESEYAHGAINGMIHAGRLLFGENYSEYVDWPPEQEESPCDGCCGCGVGGDSYLDELQSEEADMEFKCLELYAFTLSADFATLTDADQDMAREQLGNMEHILYLIRERIKEV
jgi:hypothetical protein